MSKGKAVAGQGGQVIPSAPSQEGHAAGPASATAPSTMPEEPNFNLDLTGCKTIHDQLLATENAFVRAVAGYMALRAHAERLQRFISINLQPDEPMTLFDYWNMEKRFEEGKQTAFDVMRNRAEKAEAALAEAEKDAERYRFIRYHSPTYFYMCWNAPVNPSYEEQDAAIDAARKEK